MVMVTIALVMAVIVTNIYAKKDARTPAPAWAVHIAQKMYPDQPLPARRQDPADPSCDCNGRNRKAVSREGDESMCGCWGRPLSRPHRASHRTEYRHPQGYPVIITSGDADPVADSPTCLCCQRHSPYNSFTDDFERHEAEWKLVAKMADRVFFWMFLAITSPTQTALFMNMMPPKDAADMAVVEAP